MNISNVIITVELNRNEIMDILFPMIHSLKKSADHYIKFFDGNKEEDFIAYVIKENAHLVRIFESFSQVIDRADLIKDIHYHCKELLKDKLEKRSVKSNG